LFLNYYLIIVLLNQSPAANRVRLPAGRRVSSLSAQHTERAAGQQSRFHHKGPVVFIIAEINPMDYHVWDAMLEAYSKLKTKPKTIAEVKEALQVICCNLP